MTIEEKVSNLKIAYGSSFKNIHILKKSKTKEYTLTSIQNSQRCKDINVNKRTYFHNRNNHRIFRGYVVVQPHGLVRSMVIAYTLATIKHQSII